MPLMMMGTPARPGMTSTGLLLSASATALVPIQMASITPVRIAAGPDCSLQPN